MKNAPSLNGRALHYSPTRWIHACTTHYITFNITACLLCRDALRFTRNGLARVVAAIPFHRLHSRTLSSSSAFNVFPPRSLVQASFIMHEPQHRCMTFARTTPWRVTTRHTMMLIHGVATCTIARMHACEATDRERKEWRRLSSARGRKDVSKPVRNSEREQREVRRDSVSSFFSAFVSSSFSAVASRLPSGAPKFLFSLKGETGEKHIVVI